MSKPIVMGIDIYDHWGVAHESGVFYDEDHMRQLVRNCADAGITELYWRVDAIGRVTYRSNVRTRIGTPPRSRADSIEANPMYAMSVEQLILRQCDPPAIAVDEAHKCGLKIHAYMTLFDEYYPGAGESDFEIAHPEFTWQHRHVNHRLRGLLSYFYPEVREHRLAELKELLAYGFDGIYLDTARSHSGIQPVSPLPLTGGDPYAYYGYNKEEVAAYRAEFGAEPPTTNPRAAEPDAYHRFRGRFLTQFIREARAQTKRAGVGLMCGVYTDADCYLSPAGRRGRVPLGLFYHDVDTWWRQDLVDGFVILAEHRRFGARDWRDHSAQQFAAACKAGKRAYVQGATQARIDELSEPPCELPVAIESNRDLFIKALSKGVGECLSASADGVYLYDAVYVEKYDYWKELKKILGGDR